MLLYILGFISVVVIAPICISIYPAKWLYVSVPYYGFPGYILRNIHTHADFCLRLYHQTSRTARLDPEIYMAFNRFITKKKKKKNERKKTEIGSRASRFFVYVELVSEHVNSRVFIGSPDRGGFLGGWGCRCFGFGGKCCFCCV